MNFATYAESLPGTVLDQLYQSLYVCQAILHSLPPVAKQYVVRMLHVGAIPAEWLDQWASSQGQSKHLAAVDKLKQLQLLKHSGHQRTSGSAPAMLALHPDFFQQLKAVQAGANGQVAQEQPQMVRQAAPGPEKLERYALMRWEGLLLYLISPAPPNKPPQAPAEIGLPGLDVDHLLLQAGLISTEPRAIAEQGFQFLLLDTYSQLWLLLQQYIANAQKKAGSELVHVISFLLQMGFREVGVPFPLASLNPLQANIAAHLSQLGLLAPFRVGGKAWVSPSRLALALSGGPSSEVQQEVSEGYVIVETNYRVYAYTTSELQVAILKLFVRAECRLPNLFVGTLTRESVTQALDFGVQADQIISFMQQHAHPHVLHKVPVVPEVVSDQVRLWQADTQRVRHQKAVLYDSFPTLQKYGLAVSFARQHGWLLWQNDEQGRLVSQASGHDQMRTYIKLIK
ncbi:hypothetical protein ABBQ38_012436 [Trebouxia sp. C0009 RCD-2024]